MGLFGFGKKKDPQPVPAQQPEQKPVEISGPPYQQFVIVDGQWHLNPKYDPSAPKPAEIKVTGLDLDEDEKEDKDEDEEEDDED